MDGESVEEGVWLSAQKKFGAGGTPEGKDDDEEAGRTFVISCGTSSRVAFVGLAGRVAGMRGSFVRWFCGRALA
jgi:hypothetical protein